ncbi:DUF4150 domain-containing protein (plasmid) [Pseudoalteromonas piscicida]|uniref:DUF4150 domain-containing protein n=1 Tax=Pseudoalteromonas TaxID=53246 RepID=UPI001572D006|nr:MULTISPECIES: DUF4150 domain-containing protein [Pseudoalteromonas]NSY33549.1 DUF4150 domain-containing protein [Pseudoalteromonas sp. JC28]UDM63592.1 DUF4150 domain-containing protein [Pseudoalteromonas piscicida]
MSFIAAVKGKEPDSIQYDQDAMSATLRVGGSVSWRHNNPALLKLTIAAKNNGAIGCVNGIAVFPDKASGENAFIDEIARAKYGDMMLGEMITEFVSDYIVPPPKWNDEKNEPILPHQEPETGMDMHMPIDNPRAFLDLVERKIGWQAGTEEQIEKDVDSEAQQVGIVSGQNVLINGRTAVHKDSGGMLNTIDVCWTKIGKVVVPIPYSNLAKSGDAASTASSVKINGNPAANIKSNFSKSTGDQPGKKKGIASGTIKGKAEFITSSFDVYIEGKPAVRQGDLMISNSKNTPPSPLNQPGGATPSSLSVAKRDATGTEQDPIQSAFGLNNQSSRSLISQGNFVTKQGANKQQKKLEQGGQ